ncbi:hypothetical protein ABZ682_18670 [Streptomyces griseoviridis]|uniref:hypothetical protein n=1 Tax=Streptomyces griseoviridis TaxID=45398 RepID=UPI0033C0D891
MLGQSFVVACVALGVHAPADCALDYPTTGRDDEALGAVGPADDAQAQPEAFAGPVDEFAGVAAVGPDLGDLRLGEAKALELVPEVRAGSVRGDDGGAARQDQLTQ